MWCCCCCCCCYVWCSAVLLMKSPKNTTDKQSKIFPYCVRTLDAEKWKFTAFESSFSCCSFLLLVCFFCCIHNNGRDGICRSVLFKKHTVLQRALHIHRILTSFTVFKIHVFVVDCVYICWIIFSSTTWILFSFWKCLPEIYQE